jgi:hypothetical protein
VGKLTEKQYGNNHPIPDLLETPVALGQTVEFLVEVGQYEGYNAYTGKAVFDQAADGRMVISQFELAKKEFIRQPVKELTIYITPHSHVDIGYTEPQPEIEAKQVDNLLQALELIDQTRGNPQGSKYRWTVEAAWGKAAGKLPMKGMVDYLGKFMEQLYSDDYVTALHHVRDRFGAVKVDRLRVKPIVKITGEFWAQTTEGDGNFNMFAFLNREGAQIIVEPIGTWIMYMIHQVVQKIRDFRGLEEGAVMPPAWRLDKQAKIEWAYRQRLAKMRLAEMIFAREYHKIVSALGGTAHKLVNQYELQRVGHPYYNSRAGGGEGHLEVAKNIYYSNHELCHMVLSLKPFGCMPSTQSDGAQSAVVSHFKDMIFLPIETSGEGEINAHSRVQMALGEAKAKAKLEFADVLKNLGKTADELREYVGGHEELQSALYPVPKYKGVIGTAANFAIHVAEKMGASVPYHQDAH